MNRLRAEAVTVAYPRGDKVLEQLYLQIRAGELLVLLGCNGAGKTTLLRALAGHLRPQRGRVFVDEVAMEQWSGRALARRLTFMPQFEGNDTPLSVRDVVRLGRIPHRGWWLPLTIEDEGIVDEALQQVGLTGVQDRLASTLSGGQWRRMVLARSLAQGASIMLLDEPISGLDLKHQHEALVQLRRLVSGRTTAVVVSLHDLNLAAMYADRIALLDQGTIVSLGTATEVLTKEHIQQAFEIEVEVIRHPFLDLPLIVPTLDVAQVTRETRGQTP
jgi:iron complex transport system ATP-binding protein